MTSLNYLIRYEALILPKVNNVQSPNINFAMYNVMAAQSVRSVHLCLSCNPVTSELPFHARSNITNLQCKPVHTATTGT